MHSVKCQYASFVLLSVTLLCVVMQSAVLQSVALLSVFLQSVILPNVVAPWQTWKTFLTSNLLTLELRLETPKNDAKVLTQKNRFKFCF
jgi:hypothetical protein